MSRIGSIFPRSTSLLTSDQLRAALNRTQRQLLDAQSQITSGKVVNRPSDAPDKVSAILGLNGSISARDQYARNLQFGLGLLNSADQGLADASEVLLEAKSIAMSQIGIGSSGETRRAEASVVTAQIQALIDTANRRYQDVPMFGGNRFGGNNSPVFTEFLGGVRYTGSTSNLEANVGLSEPLGINSNGAEAFGALSSRVKSKVDLDPQATAATRLIELDGAQGQGIRTGSVTLTVDGTAVSVDLSEADTLGDVVTRINAAIGGIDASAGTLAVGGAGLQLAANAGHTVSIADTQTGKVAGDLGIAISATGATVTGGDVHRRLTELTELSALGIPVDLTSGLKITHGPVTTVADFSSATTIQDMINVVDQLDLGLDLSINDSGTGLNLISQVSGIELSIGENAGGTTATDLGLRTFGTDTRLDELNHGIGVSRAQGADDFAFELHDGRTINVNIDGVTTVGELLTTIQSAAAAAGVTSGAPGDAGTDFNVGLATDGNGLLFEDGTTGGGPFRVLQLGTSLAATDLGIVLTAGSGNTLAGGDVAKVRAEGLFTHLINLRDSLTVDDSRGITLAASGLETDIGEVARVRADVGVRAKRITQQQQRSDDLKIVEQTMLSNLQDADLTEVLTRFTQLQQQLEASLRAGAQQLQLSLLDFLR